MIKIYSVSDKYLPDFVLHGTTEENFSEKLYDDLKAVIKVYTTPVLNRLCQEFIIYYEPLVIPIVVFQCSVVDDPVDYAQAIVANTNDW